MVAVSIEQLKREYTDKYVKVDAAHPELARFADLVGQVKTVNMSRRALVEFLDYHLNIGWYDIDLSCLTVVPKPTEEELAKRAEAKKAPEKPEGKAAPTTGAKQTADAAKPAVAGTKAGGPAKPAGGGKMSVADMLAAARGGGGGGGAAKPAAPKAKADAPAKPAAKPAAPAAGGAPMDRAKMSVADMLAAARTGGASAAPAAKPAPVEEEEAEEPAAEAAPVAKPAKAAGPKASGGRVDRSSMSVADMIAHCRSADAS